MRQGLYQEILRTLKLKENQSYNPASYGHLERDKIKLMELGYDEDSASEIQAFLIAGCYAEIQHISLEPKNDL